MKTTIHTPTADFAFVETEYEGARAELNAEILEQHEAVVQGIKGGVGIDNKTFIALLDELWDKESIQADPGIFETMSHSQKEIMRAFKLVIQRAKDRKK